MKILISALIFATFNLWSAEIKNLNFQQEGEISKIIIDLDQETFAERFHIKEDKQIIVDLKNAKGEKSVLRGIDTSEFSGSIVYISAYDKPGSNTDTRFAIQLRDNVRSRLINNGKRLVLEIENRYGAFAGLGVQDDSQSLVAGPKEIAEINTPRSNRVIDILDNLTLSGKKRYIGKQIALNVQDISVIDILRMIADVSGFNIIVDDAVKAAKPMTLTLTDIPWDEALDIVLDLNKLVAKRNGNILLVNTLAQATKEAEDKIKNDELNRQKEPLVTKIIPISFATIADITKILTDYLSERGKITSDVRTNSLIVKDTVSTIDRMVKIIRELDKQTPQILIEGRIIEAQDREALEIGFSSLSAGYDPVSAVESPVIPGTVPGVGQVPPGGGLPQIGFQQGPGFAFNAIPTTNTSTAIGVSIGVMKRLVGLDAKLSLLEFEEKIRTVSSPKIVAQNNQPATLTQTLTENIVVQAPPVAGATVAINTIQPITASTNITVTPQVTNEGSINLTLQITKESLGSAAQGSAAPPSVTSSNVNTNVLVDNGSTVVIGGLYTVSESESVSGIPFLKDIPLLGWFFRSPYNPTKTRSELVVFITPQVINQEEAGLSSGSLFNETDRL